MNMGSARYLKLIMLVLGVALFSEWFHLVELAPHSAQASVHTEHAKCGPSPKETSISASDCSSPFSHQDSSSSDQDCVVHCHAHCHAGCSVALVSGLSHEHGLSHTQAGFSSNSLLVLDPHYGSLLRPPAA